jgi:four helix bundle protein
MAAIEDVRETRAWRLAHQLHLRVELFLGSPDFRYQYDHCDQLHNAATTGPRQIADGSSRLKPREFASCVRAAKRSEREVLRHLESAHAQRLITGDELLINRQLIRRAMKAAAGLIRDLERGAYF